MPYETLAGALRLSTKYEIANLREKAVRAIIKIWPRSDKMRRLDAAAFNSHRVGPYNASLASSYYDAHA